MSRGRRSLNSQSQSESSSPNTDAVNECVRYILCREGSKLPIKRVDIAHHLEKEYETSKKELPCVILGAERLLKRIYGYSLEKHQSGSGVQYMVMLSEPSEDTFLSPLIEPNHQILLNAALAHIFMSGGSVKDEDLWKFLQNANLMKVNDGSVKKLFTKTFSSQLYITCKKDASDDRQTQIILQWGPRANKEVSKMFILKKVAQAMNEQPEFWSEQYADANGQINISQL